MSKNIIIDEAGLPKALTVDVLRTNKQGGGSEDWLPADGTNLVELDIGGSGTYRASDYNAYGISVARVTPKYGGGATPTAALQPVFANLHIPAIREGGNPKYMSARLLKTNLQGGGTCLWVPEDEVNLESKYVNHSGTYTARADDCYGYDQITVSGVDVEITQDEDGDDVEKITDGGVVTEEKLPYAIEILNPPIKTTYAQGEVINYSGISVRAILKNGQPYTLRGYTNGIIPFNELIFPTTTADAGKTIYTDDNGLNFWRIECDIECRLFNNNLYYASSDVGVFTSGGTQRIACVAIPGRSGSGFATFYDGHLYIYLDDRSGTGTALAYDNAGVIKSDGYTSIRFADGFDRFFNVIGEYPASEVNPYHKKPTDYHAIAGGMNVPVQWERPDDRKLLETTFEITVT